MTVRQMLTLLKLRKEANTSLIVIIIQLLKLCGAILNFGNASKSFSGQFPEREKRE